MSDSLQPHGLYRLLCPWNFPGKNPGVGSHFLLQGISPTQGLNLGFPIAGRLYHWSHQGSPTDINIWGLFNETRGFLLKFPLGKKVPIHIFRASNQLLEPNTQMWTNIHGSFDESLQHERQMPNKPKKKKKEIKGVKNNSEK